VETNSTEGRGLHALTSKVFLPFQGERGQARASNAWGTSGEDHSSRSNSVLRKGRLQEVFDEKKAESRSIKDWGFAEGPFTVRRGVKRRRPAFRDAPVFKEIESETHWAHCGCQIEEWGILQRLISREEVGVDEVGKTKNGGG